MSTLRADRIRSFSGGNIVIENTIDGSVTTALTASYVNASNVDNLPQSFPYTGSAIISGSLTIEGEFIVPVGTSGSRPTTPQSGSLRFETEEKALTFYNGTSWIQLGKPSATGGTVSTYTSGGIDYKVHTFLSSETFSVIGSEFTVDILAVGGGGGGNGYSGGGGGGEVAYISQTTISPGSYPIVIGSGGTGNDVNGGDSVGGDGSVTTLFGETIRAGGGGRGSDSTQSVGANVSNGGGGGSRSAGHVGTIGINVSIPFTRYGGNTGGTGKNNSDFPGGGGAGAGGNGETPPANTSPGGAGGVGVQVGTIYDGENNYYWAGGGGATAYYNDRGGNGGIGGGGGGTGPGGSGTGGGSALNAGGTVSRYLGGDGGANTGGGGGSGGGDGVDGLSVGMSGDGGSGIVIIRYAI